MGDVTYEVRFRFNFDRALSDDELAWIGDVASDCEDKFADAIIDVFESGSPGSFSIEYHGPEAVA